MDTTEALAKAEEILKPFARVTHHPSPDRVDFTILPTASAIRTFVAEKWGYLTAITGVDRPGTAATMPEPKQWARVASFQEESSVEIEHEGSIEILYHFCCKAAVVTLRTSVRYSFPVVPSVCDILPAATLYERELIEMFGVKVVGTPIKEHLLLPDDWPDGTFPLRKSFKSLQASSTTGEA